jgi:hypothetical protein
LIFRDEQEGEISHEGGHMRKGCEDKVTELGQEEGEIGMGDEGPEAEVEGGGIEDVVIAGDAVTVVEKVDKDVVVEVLEGEEALLETDLIPESVQTPNQKKHQILKNRNSQNQKLKKMKTS